MAIITTSTTVNISGTFIEIVTRYEEDSGERNILSIEIKSTNEVSGGTNFKENELVADVNNYPSGLNIYLNSEGELIIIDDNASKYSINSNGELIFTE